MKNGVPFHVALGIPEREMHGFRLDKIEMSAMQIIFQELDGAVRFNFDTEEFEEVKRS